MVGVARPVVQDQRAFRVGRLDGPGGHVIGGGHPLVRFECGLVEGEQFVGAQEVRHHLEAFGAVEDVGPAAFLEGGELRGGLVTKPNESRLGLLPVGLLHGDGEELFGDRVTAGGGELSAHDPVEVVAPLVPSVADTRLLDELCDVGLVQDAVDDGDLQAGAGSEAVEEPRPPVDDRFLLALLGGEVVDVADAQRQRPLVGPEPGHAAGEHGLVAEELLSALRGVLDAGDGGVVSADSPGAPAALLAGLLLGLLVSSEDAREEPPCAACALDGGRLGGRFAPAGQVLRVQVRVGLLLSGCWWDGRCRHR